MDDLERGTGTCECAITLKPGLKLYYACCLYRLESL